MASFNSIDFGNRLTGNSEATRLREALDNRVQGNDEASESGATFGHFLKNLAQEANTAQLVADSKLQDVAAGRGKDLHGAVLSMEKADIQFRLLTQVRNKVIEAYREIMRMQV